METYPWEVRFLCSTETHQRSPWGTPMLEILSIELDERLQAYCITARCTYEKFLELTKGAEENLEIQRRIIREKSAYSTLRADLKRGCILPPLVLAVQDSTLSLPPSATRKDNPDLFTQMEEHLSSLAPSQIYIIDGLQRTNAIRQTVEELPESNRDEFLQKRVRLELWVNITFGAVAYRMLLLNAGQRPMSMKHQVEILSFKLKDELATIPGIEIVTSLESRRRVRGGQFHLSKLSQAFQAWLQGQPNVDLRNTVMEQLVAESAIETLGSVIGSQSPASGGDSFKELVRWLVEIDHLLPDMDFLGNETVLQGIAAAVGAAERSQTLAGRMKSGLTRLRDELRENPNTDPLAVEDFKALKGGIDTAKRNVGQATREMVFRAFQEYFVADGNKTMQECWRFAGGA